MDKIIESNLVFSCPKFKVYEEIVKLNTQKITKRWQIFYNDSVVIIGITKEKEIIMINEYRENIGKKILLLPGGGVKENEEIETAAMREFEEETGYYGENIKLLTVMDQSNSKIKHKIYYYIIENVSFKGQKLEEDEEISVKLFPMTELFIMAEERNLEDELDITALLLFKSKYVDSYDK